MSEPNGGRHQVGRVRGRVAKHDALVAGTETVARVAALGATNLESLVDATGDVGALAVERDRDATGGTIEANARRVVSDREDFATYDLRDFDIRLGCHLAGDVNETGCRHRLNGHARARIGGKQRVEDRIRDAVTHLVGVTFGNGLGRKKLLTHRFRLSRNEAIWPTRPAATSSFEPT